MKRIRQRMLGPEEIIVEDLFIQNSFELERAYLLRLKPQRLLAGFYETAGLEPEAPRYKGWESSEIAGHTMGHYLTALSQAWACTGDERFLEKIRGMCGRPGPVPERGMAMCLLPRKKSLTG